MNLELENGKYQIIQDEEGFRCLRNGEPWRDLTGDKMVSAMLAYIEDMRARWLAERRQYQQLRELIDKDSVNLTHADTLTDAELFRAGYLAVRRQGLVFYRNPDRWEFCNG